MNTVRSRRPHLLLTLGAVVQLAGCGSGAEILVPVFLDTQIAGGQSQMDTVFATLPQPLRVRARDQSGKPVAGVTVLWDQGAPGQGALSATTTTTGPDGTAEVRFTLGPHIGPYTIHARVAGAPLTSRLTFEATAQPGRPANLLRLGGGGGWARAGELVEQPYAVRVTDRHGNPSPGATVQWLVTAGSGHVRTSGPPVNGTDFVVQHMLGPEQGTQAVLASVTGLPGDSQVAFSVTGVGLVINALLSNPWDCYYYGICTPEFFPRDATIPVGGVVVWVMPSSDRCDVTFEDNPAPPASGPLAHLGAYHLRTFSAPGLYRYRCTTQSTDFTSGMAGSISVVAANPGP